MKDSTVIIVPTEINDSHIKVSHPELETMINVSLLSTELFGLKRQFSTDNNDNDFPWYPINADSGKNCLGQISEFSYDNQKATKKHFMEILNKKEKLVIVEIGVSRSYENYEFSSTSVFLSNKRDTDIYVGIDIRDVSELTDPSKNIYTIQGNSENKPVILDYLKSLGIDKIDVFMIDGFHSVNQVYKEWEYVSLLSNDGVVIMHDTNSHPGPYFLIESIDDRMFDVYKYCNDVRDWGVSVAVRKI